MIKILIQRITLFIGKFYPIWQNKEGFYFISSVSKAMKTAAKVNQEL